MKNRSEKSQPGNGNPLLGLFVHSRFRIISLGPNAHAYVLPRTPIEER